MEIRYFGLGYDGVVRFLLVLCFDGVDWQLVLLVDVDFSMVAEFSCRWLLAALGLLWWCEGGEFCGFGRFDLGLL